MVVRGYFDAANLNGVIPDRAISRLTMRWERIPLCQLLLKIAKYGVRLITGVAASHVTEPQASFAPHHIRPNFPAVKILGNGKNAPGHVGPEYSRSGLL